MGIPIIPPSFLLSAFWGVAVLVGIIGWGFFAARWCDIQKSLGFGHKAALGMAVLVILGGLLNLIGIVSVFLCVALVVLGVLYAVYEAHENRLYLRKCFADFSISIKNPITWTLLLLTIGVLITTFLASAWSYSIGWQYIWNYNNHDDAYAYMVFPQKMLQTGSIGADPFNERRMESSLGGQSFLHALLLAVGGNESLNLLESGIGLTLICLLFATIARRHNVSWNLIFLGELLLLFIPYPRVNITAIYTAIALLVALFDLGLQSRLAERRGNFIIMAVLMAAVCAVKSTYVPVVALYLTIITLASAVLSPHSYMTVCTQAVRMGIIVAICLLPWMILMYISSGTFFYPVLGKGFHASSYNDFTVWSAGKLSIGLIKSQLEFIFSEFWAKLFILFAIVFVFQKASAALFPGIIAIIFSVLVASLLLSHISPFGNRYALPLGVAASIIFVTWSLPVRGVKIPLFSRHGISLIMLLACFIFQLWGINPQYYIKNLEIMVKHITASIANTPLDTPEVVLRYRGIFEGLPENAKILARLDRPYLLDFTKHSVWVADVPGGASLPPGMPYEKPASMLREYLLSQDIRYVAYSYANEANYSYNKYKSRLKLRHPWVRSQTSRILDFQRCIAELSESYKHVYDDGEIYVLDLAEASLKKPEIKN